MKVSKHGFYPFIHYTRTFKKYSNKNGIKEKKREICYSAHLDRYIFSYYGFKLNQFYNQRAAVDGIHDSVIAYRNNLYGKSNIHFAKKAIDFIKSINECYIIIGDFTNFFDRLDHRYLKKMLCELLKVDRLPDDYFAVFKNITKYSIWDLEKLLEIHGFENNRKGIEKFNQLPVALSIEEFRRLKKHYIQTNTNNYGIPQGSSISAVLSNIYMLEFDRKIKEYVTQENGLYMRYSDDFIVVLPKKAEDEEYLIKSFYFIKSVINSIRLLELQPEKTQFYEYTNGRINSCDSLVYSNFSGKTKNRIDYLGFSFDGINVSIRDKTISKYYYRLYRKLKTIVKNKGYTKRGNRISNENLYLKYSIKGAFEGKGNFISYVIRAEKVFGTHLAVSRVKKVHMQKIRRKLKKLLNDLSTDYV